MTTLEENVSEMKIQDEAPAPTESPPADAPAAKKPKEKKQKNNKKPQQNGAAGAGGHPVYMTPQPAYIDERIALFDQLKLKHDAEIEAKEKLPISITLPDGKVGTRL